jgi:hypothetical protein
MPPEHCNRYRGSRIMRQSTSVRAAATRAIIERFRDVTLALHDGVGGRPDHAEFAQPAETISHCRTTPGRATPRMSTCRA